jgi:two-component system, OmpR family, sensor histidine kinase KdpD
VRRFLENLVGLARIDIGALTVALEPVDLLDAVSLAAHDLRDLLRDRRIVTRIPPNLPLVSADPHLLHHVLINLLSNAVQHGASPELVVAGGRSAEAVTLTIAGALGPDQEGGDGSIAFEALHAASGDRTGGSGLGLAIVRGFADAMQAGVAATRSDGGEYAVTLSFRPFDSGTAGTQG